MDWTLLLIVIVLVVMGLIMQYSASSYDIELVQTQALYAGGGIVLIFIMRMLPAGFYHKVALVAYIGTLLLTVAAGLVGRTVKGARRWLAIGPVSFQPSEALKVALIMFIAALICKYYTQIQQVPYTSMRGFARQVFHREEQTYLKDHKGYIIMFLLISSAAGVVVIINKDFGTGLIIFTIGIAMMWVMSPRGIWLLGVLALGVVAGIGVIVAFPYRRDRISAWLHPEQTTSDLGYQIKEGLYAIGSGGWFGRGLGKSVQKDVIPEPHTDMIYSIVCEELGVIGGLVVIVLFVLLILRLKKNYDQTVDLFGKMIIAGVMTHVGVQAAMNMAVLTGLIPNTGVPLPFISYGGTSLLVLLAEIGMVMSVRRVKEPVQEAGA